MLNKNRAWILLVMGSGFFVALDQFLKFQSRHAWNSPHLLSSFFGWQPFLNPGVAFGLPLPNWLVILLTLPILALLSWQLLCPSLSTSTETLNLKTYFLKCAPLAGLLSGALSNLFDRILYQHTVDYWLVVTAIINLADILIVVGGVLYYFQISRNGNRR